jgi:hypothetical protein
MVTRWPTPTAGDPFVLTADLVAVVMTSDQHGGIQQQHRVGHAVCHGAGYRRVEHRAGVAARRLVIGRVGVHPAAAQHLLGDFPASLVGLPGPGQGPVDLGRTSRVNKRVSPGRWLVSRRE